MTNAFRIVLGQLLVEVWQRNGTSNSTLKMRAVLRCHGLLEKIVFRLEARNILGSSSEYGSF
jgi:hypothetical protein